LRGPSTFVFNANNLEMRNDYPTVDNKLSQADEVKVRNDKRDGKKE